MPPDQDKRRREGGGAELGGSRQRGLPQEGSGFASVLCQLCCCWTVGEVSDRSPPLWEARMTWQTISGLDLIDKSFVTGGDETGPQFGTYK